MSDLRTAAERCREMFTPPGQANAPNMYHDWENASVECVRDLATIADAYLAEHPADEEPIIWTDAQCLTMNAMQHDHRLHGYTCGNDSQNHRPLIATRHGWRCADCDYRQGWSHETRKDAPCSPPTA